MKKRCFALLLLLCMLCLSGCVDSLLNSENLATTDVLQLKLLNREAWGYDGTAYIYVPFFTEEEVEKATGILLEGEAIIKEKANDREVQRIPAEKMRVRKIELYSGEKLKESYAVIDIPYEGLSVGVEYSLHTKGLKVGLAGDGQEPVKEPVEVSNTVLPFTPKYVGEVTPVPDATPIPDATPAPAPEVPQTGDTSPVAVWCVLIGISIAAAAVILRRKQEV